jgi:hypothetical protein
MTTNIPFTINGYSITKSNPNNYLTEEEFNEYLIKTHSELYCTDSIKAKLLLDKKPLLTLDLFHILANGYLTVDNNNLTKYSLLENIVQILRLADLLKIPNMHTDFDQTIIATKGKVLTYLSCFRLLEIRYGIEIFNNRCGNKKYSNLILFNIEDVLIKNDILPIKSYFKKPAIKDFINLVFKSSNSYTNKYWSNLTVNLSPYAKYFLDQATHFIGKDNKEINIKELEFIFDFIKRYNIEKTYQKTLMSIKLFDDNFLEKCAFNDLMKLIFRSRNSIIRQMHNKIIQYLDSKINGDLPINGSMIYQYLTRIRGRSEFKKRNNPFKYKSSRANCDLPFFDKSLEYYIATSYFDLFVAHVLYFSKFGTFQQFFVFANKEKKQGIMPVNYLHNEWKVRCEEHKILYLLYHYDIEKITFHNEKEKSEYIELIGASGRYTKKAV